jgi:hypothetical protein
MYLPIDAYATLLTLPTLDVPHELLGSGTAGDPEFDKSRERLLNYVMSRGDTEKMSHAKYHLWRHIQRTRHHLALELEDRWLDEFGEWAETANAVYLLPDGTIRDPLGRVLLAKDGRSDPEARLPHPLDARQRKSRHDAMLEARGITVIDHLPPVVAEGEVLLRSSEEASRRALALFLVARRAKALFMREPIDVAMLERSAPVAAGALSPEERAFLAAASPDEQEIAKFLWRFEALALLVWALGGCPELPFPSEQCGAIELEQFMLSVTEEQFLSHARLRPAGPILDALDLHLRCHWALVNARSGRDTRVADLDADVVPERHHALNWLVRFENAEWDDVDTPT